jgi:DNA-binding transcriptional MerR regulator
MPSITRLPAPEDASGDQAATTPSSPEEIREPGDGYRIGTVAGLTGLDPHTIRAWERRHGAVRPWRTERGTRLYGDRAIERLQLLKALVDGGEPIRRVAALSDEALRERLQRLAGLSLHGEAGPTREGCALRVGLLSPTTAAQLASSARGLPGFQLAVSEARREALVETLRRRPCEVLVLELEQLGSEPLRALDACLVASEARLVVIVYSFARRGVLTRLARRGARLVRGPLSLEQLHRSLCDLVAGDRATARRESPSVDPAPAGDERYPERRFDAERLARISEIATSIECECPHHLSGLVRSLLAFEEYARDCESRDEEDARMHRRLADGTAEARAGMERLLEALCEYEGIEV